MILRRPRPPQKSWAAVRMLALQGWSWVRANADQLKAKVLPPKKDEGDRPDNPALPESLPHTPQSVEPLPIYYQQYHCTVGTPLNCPQSLHVAAAAAGHPVLCPVCGFPAPLADGSVIGGHRGSYRVERFWGQRGMSRLYAATQVGAEIPLTLREYLLPRRYFNDREQSQRRTMFLNLVGLALADGRSQDLRIIAPIEAIAPPNEERAYLVLPVEDQALSLSYVLGDRSPFSTAEVEQVLRQVLQTLVGLHQQKYVLSPGRLQSGVVHGNLRLSSLLWVVQNGQGFVYLTDFAIWEECFSPTVLEQSSQTPQEDLAALGFVAFYLLKGGLADASGERLSPKLAQHWMGVYPPLRHFILRLLAIEVPFEQAEAAHRALLQLPPEPIANQLAPAGETDNRKAPWWKRHGLPAATGVMLVVMMGWVLWSLLRPRPLEAQKTPPPCCFEEVGAVPEGAFTYTAIAGDVWEDLLELQPMENPDLTVAEQLALDQPKLTLTYQPSDSIDEALEQLRNREADFAVLPLLEPLPIDMAAEVIAYDGLAVVVAFNYQGRSQGLPDSLRGSIPLDTVQQLYQNELESWQEVNPAIQLPLQRYINRSRSIQTVFQHFMGQDERGQRSPPISLETIPMLRTIIRDFEESQIGSIGITSLSSIAGQCSVYPLAIQAPGRSPVQPFVLTNGKAIQPTVDLCRRKGAYHIDAEVMRSQTYPLAYPIAVVYRRDNRLPPIGLKFAALLLSDEGQSYLLQINTIGATTQSK